MFISIFTHQKNFTPKNFYQKKNDDAKILTTQNILSPKKFDATKIFAQTKDFVHPNNFDPSKT